MRSFAALIALSLLASCSRTTKEDAQQAVRTYVDRVIAAYRTSDASLVDPLVGDAQGMKLVGLIGVKSDAGVALDAKLLELQFTRVEPQGKGWVVETEERWYYKDRKIGTGEQVGNDSLDSYAMRYTFVPRDGRLILENLEFVAEPVVGRKSAPMPVDARAFHGIAPDAVDVVGTPKPPQGDARPRDGAAPPPSGNGARPGVERQR